MKLGHVIITDTLYMPILLFNLLTPSGFFMYHQV